VHAIEICALAAVQFVVLHGPDGQEFYVNPQQITSIREPVGTDLRHFPKGTHCVVVTTSGKFLAVREPCAEVRDHISLLR
jgi:uncharacterized protein YlzI (FlbEa/FlbD family)